VTKLGVERDEAWDRLRNGEECVNFIGLKLKTCLKLRGGWITS
jgi:hypothetical protein